MNSNEESCDTISQGGKGPQGPKIDKGLAPDGHYFLPNFLDEEEVIEEPGAVITLNQSNSDEDYNKSSESDSDESEQKVDQVIKESELDKIVNKNVCVKNFKTENLIGSQNQPRNTNQGIDKETNQGIHGSTNQNQGNQRNSNNIPSNFGENKNYLETHSSQNINHLNSSKFTNSPNERGERSENKNTVRSKGSNSYLNKSNYASPNSNINYGGDRYDIINNFNKMSINSNKHGNQRDNRNTNQQGSIGNNPINFSNCNFYNNNYQIGASPKLNSPPNLNQKVNNQNNQINNKNDINKYNYSDYTTNTSSKSVNAYNTQNSHMNTNQTKGQIQSHCNNNSPSQNSHNNNNNNNYHSQNSHSNSNNHQVSMFLNNLSPNMNNSMNNNNMNNNMNNNNFNHISNYSNNNLSQNQSQYDNDNSPFRKSYVKKPSDELPNQGIAPGSPYINERNMMISNTNTTNHSSNMSIPYINHLDYDNSDENNQIFLTKNANNMNNNQQNNMNPNSNSNSSSNSNSGKTGPLYKHNSVSSQNVTLGMNLHHNQNSNQNPRKNYNHNIYNNINNNNNNNNNNINNKNNNNINNSNSININNNERHHFHSSNADSTNSIPYVSNYDKYDNNLDSNLNISTNSNNSNNNSRSETQIGPKSKSYSTECVSKFAISNPNNQNQSSNNINNCSNSNYIPSSFNENIAFSMNPGMTANLNNKTINNNLNNNTLNNNLIGNLPNMGNPPNMGILPNMGNLINMGNLPNRPIAHDHNKVIFEKKPCFYDNNDKLDETEEFENIEDLFKLINCELHDFIRTQRGSRILQKQLNKVSQENLFKLLYKLSGHFKELMIDIYGNYFSQKLFQCCTYEQRIFIINNISTDFLFISCNNAGTHSMQSLIELINMLEEEDIVKEAIKNDILQLSYNVNGTHVMQKIISSIKEENREHINAIVLDNLGKLVMDSNGICVVKKFINGNINGAIKKRILDTIYSNCLEILQNPFGNYIIQHILDTWDLTTCKDILKIIHLNISSLSMQKFSSNVVEKSLDMVDSDLRKRMIKELFNATKIASLLKNKFGSFVIQKAIEIMSKEEKYDIREYLNKKLSITSKQEKSRLIGLIDLLA